MTAKRAFEKRFDKLCEKQPDGTLIAVRHGGPGSFSLISEHCYRIVGPALGWNGVRACMTEERAGKADPKFVYAVEVECLWSDVEAYRAKKAVSTQAATACADALQELFEKLGLPITINRANLYTDVTMRVSEQAARRCAQIAGTIRMSLEERGV